MIVYVGKRYWSSWYNLTKNDYQFDLKNPLQWVGFFLCWKWLSMWEHMMITSGLRLWIYLRSKSRKHGKINIKHLLLEWQRCISSSFLVFIVCRATATWADWSDQNLHGNFYIISYHHLNRNRGQPLQFKKDIVDQSRQQVYM